MREPKIGTNTQHTQWCLILKNGSYEPVLFNESVEKIHKTVLSLQFESDSQLTPWNRNYISLLADFLIILYDSV